MGSTGNGIHWQWDPLAMDLQIMYLHAIYSQTIRSRRYNRFKYRRYLYNFRRFKIILKIFSFLVDKSRILVYTAIINKKEAFT